VRIKPVPAPENVDDWSHEPKRNNADHAVRNKTDKNGERERKRFAPCAVKKCERNRGTQLEAWYKCKDNQIKHYPYGGHTKSFFSSVRKSSKMQNVYSIPKEVLYVHLESHFLRSS
jgi:hypothetical protein